ncbi:MAG TPA: response regulator, partial [Desulfobacterales bacterium]|nr:response regulator [Desulfobacterales bacterium]
KFNIMFVDNSFSVLESLQWLFKDEPYYVFSFNNPFDTLNVIKTLDWAVVVVEQFMQKMDGVELLKKVQAHSPYTMGVIMTGYSEMKEAMDTLYPSGIYRFVKKPLDNFEIKQAVRAAIADYEANTGIKRKAI